MPRSMPMALGIVGERGGVLLSRCPRVGIAHIYMRPRIGLARTTRNHRRASGGAFCFHAVLEASRADESKVWGRYHMCITRLATRLEDSRTV